MKNEPDWRRGEYIWFGQKFKHMSATTLTLHQEVWFKVSSHSSPKGTLWLEYEPHWVKRNIKCQGQVMFDRQMNI